MHFSTDQQDDTTIFRLREERLDSRNAGQLKAEFLILAQPDIESLIVDLSDVRHIDSAGISALLLAERQMTVHDGELRLAGITGEVLSLLEMTQLDRVFRIFDTVQDALAAAPVSPEAQERKAWEEERGRATKVVDSENGADLGPDAPSARAIRAGAIVSGGSLGAVALAQIIMNTPMEDELELPTLYALGDEEDDDDDLDDAFDDDDDDDFDDDDLDEEDDEEEEKDKDKVEAEDVVEPDDLDEDFEEDDWDEEDDSDEDDDY